MVSIAVTPDGMNARAYRSLGEIARATGLKEAEVLKLITSNFFPAQKVDAFVTLYWDAEEVEGFYIMLCTSAQTAFIAEEIIGYRKRIWGY